MKQWGLGRWGALLAVLTLLVSAGVLVPLGAQAQGKKVWGLVTDCANTNPVGATVTLADGRLHYITSYGGQNAVPLELIDLDMTVRLNWERGMEFALRPEPTRH